MALIRLGRSGAGNAPRAEFDDAFSRCHDDIHRYMRRRVAPADVDDLVAEVFVRAWNRYRGGELDIAGDDWRPWLFGFARNIVAEHYRAVDRRRTLQSALDARPEPTASGADDFIGVGHITDALSQLAEPDREVLQLAAWEGLRGADLGTALGCSAGTAAVRLSRARDRLARLLEVDR